MNSKEVVGKIKSKAIEIGKKIGEKKKEILISAATIAIVGTAAGCGDAKVYTDHIDVYGAQTPSAATGPATETAQQAFERGVAAQRAQELHDKQIADQAVAAYQAAHPAPTTVTKEVPVYIPSQPRQEAPLYPAQGFEIYTPRPESAIYGDFYSIKFNGRYYDLVDIRTNQVVSIPEHMVQPIANILTGVGNTTQIPYTIYPGQAAVEQGNTVNGEGNGVFQMRVNRAIGNNYPEWFSPVITDGSVTIVPIANAAAHEADALNRAINMNWAHTNVRGER